MFGSDCSNLVLNGILSLTHDSGRKVFEREILEGEIPQFREDVCLLVEEDAPKKDEDQDCPNDTSTLVRLYFVQQLKLQQKFLIYLILSIFIVYGVCSPRFLVYCRSCEGYCSRTNFAETDNVSLKIGLKTLHLFLEEGFRIKVAVDIVD
jgi:hypothetical protein